MLQKNKERMQRTAAASRRISSVNPNTWKEIVNRIETRG